MPSIGESGASSVVNLDKVGYLPTDNVVDDRVKRGYDLTSSQSRREIPQENNLQFRHRLEQPVVASTNGASIEAFKKLAQDSGATSIKMEDFKNAKAELKPAVKVIVKNVKVMQGIKQLESMKGKELDPSTKTELIKMIATPLSTEAESTDETWKSIWQAVDGESQSVGDAKNVNGSLSVKLTEGQKSQLKQAEKVFNLTFGKDGFAETTVKVNALAGEPKGLVDEIKSDYQKISRLMLAGDNLWDTDMLATMLSAIQSKMQTNRLTFDQETIKIGLVEKERMGKKTIAKLKEAIVKADEAKSSSALSKLFGYIALGIMAIVTVVMIASGVGAVAAGFMIAAMALTVVMMVDQEMDGELITKPFTKLLVNQFNLSEEEAGYIVAAVVLVIMIALAVASGGAGASGVAGIASKVAAKVADVAARVGQIAGGAAQVVSGGAQIASGVYTYESEMLKADSKELQAFMLRLQQTLDDALESLKAALEELQDGHSRIASIMSDNDDTKKQLGANIKAG
ncbi:MAG: type III secretion system translocon subunit SctE [Candidatus Endonucleobacter bathymodioli]|uniref:Type III secretion system translocon subunit SctE n=1 Tax=Candidatus Endonucleibacter bathymodioli TaxID=539814 RepID=A0AA90NKB7_9GAMM|nr:type III secretion system translocon subunit SctE [Candidatus Endonucleobacter bathymodioli]